MAHITNAELISFTGIRKEHIPTMIKRGHLVRGEDGKFDTTHPTNVALLQRRKTINEAKIAGNAGKATAPAQPIATTLTPEEQDAIAEHQRRTKAADLAKKEQSARKYLLEGNKLDLEIARKQGQLVPSELIIPVFAQHNQELLNAFSQATDEILRRFAKMKDLTAAEKADLRAYMRDQTNTAMRKAQAGSEKRVDTVVQDFADRQRI